MVLGCEMVFFPNNHNKKGIARKKDQGERREEREGIQRRKVEPRDKVGGRSKP